MNLGAEPKKVKALIALLVIAGATYLYTSSGDGSSGTSSQTSGRTASSSPATAPLSPASPGAARDPSQPVRSARPRSTQEFRPSLKKKPGEDRPDPHSIDPTLRLDVLAKLQTVSVEGSHRNLFDFSQGPPPKPDAVKLAQGKKPSIVPSPIVPLKTDGTPAAAAKPTAPPVPLKFYGYVNAAGQAQKRAFFVEGEDIHVVTEGEVVRKRYRIVRIGVNSVVVEDTQFGSQQTLPLEEQQQG